MPRQVQGKLFVTDKGNYIIDCKVPVLQNAAVLEPALGANPGVVGTGLFLGMAHTIVVADNGQIEVRRRHSS